MKLVPFFITEKHRKHLVISCLHVFLAHAGKAVWKSEEDILTKDQILNDYCEPNGFEVEQIWIEGGIAYIQVKQGSNLSEFYTWEESAKHPQKPECWRKFFFFQDNQGLPHKDSSWFYPQDIFEAEIHELGNIGKVFDTIRQMSVKVVA
jgi:hypothetical protein